MDILIKILAFIVTVGILVTIHEFGHYLAARWARVRVLRFSVGFGRPLLARTGKDGTEWVLAAIPLGGYVKMLDSREGAIPAAETVRAFDKVPPWKRCIILLAGPAANFLLAIVLYWVLFMTGVPGLKPILDEPALGSAAAAAGVQAGDTVKRVGEEEIKVFADLRWMLLKAGVARERLDLHVEDARGRPFVRGIDLSRLTKEDLDSDFISRLGIRPQVSFAPRIGSVEDKSPAALAGLKAGDLVTQTGGKPVRTWEEFVSRIEASPAKSLSLEVERGGRALTLNATPLSIERGGKAVGQLGIKADRATADAAFDRVTTTVRYAPLKAAQRGLQKTWDMTVFSLKMMGKMITGEVSLKNLSGPLSIANYAGKSAQAGSISFVDFLALVSISLGVLNLLPIPILDGGQLLYHIAEAIKGSPVSERAWDIGQRLGLALIVLLTFFAFFNDINRFLFS